MSVFVKQGLAMVAVFFISLCAAGQNHAKFADSIRIKYKMPELAYAVISSDSILELRVLGFHKTDAKDKARINDRFRLGSNTKPITSYIAATLVKQGKISYDTKFFELYPELKSKSLPVYHHLSLKDLLTFRARLLSWTYTFNEPTEKEIKGTEQQQRYEFIKWALQQAPQDTTNRISYWSNPGYVAVGLMLEKAAGKAYESLVDELGKELNIHFAFGQPNATGKHEPWGHDSQLAPEKPGNNYKLNWLSPAGNINVSLPDYAKFITMQLRGLRGKSTLFTEEEFNEMHYGLPGFSYGWQAYTDEATHLNYSYHRGNPGTFLSQVFICKASDRAYVFMTNVQSAEAEAGLSVLFGELKKKEK